MRRCALSHADLLLDDSLDRISWSPTLNKCALLSRNAGCHIRYATNSRINPWPIHRSATPRCCSNWHASLGKARVWLFLRCIVHSSSSPGRIFALHISRGQVDSLAAGDQYSLAVGPVLYWRDDGHGPLGIRAHVLLLTNRGGAQGRRRHLTSVRGSRRASIRKCSAMAVRFAGRHQRFSSGAGGRNPSI